MNVLQARNAQGKAWPIVDKAEIVFRDGVQYLRVGRRRIVSEYLVSFLCGTLLALGSCILLAVTFPRIDLAAGWLGDAILIALACVFSALVDLLIEKPFARTESFDIAPEHAEVTYDQKNKELCIRLSCGPTVVLVATRQDELRHIEDLACLNTSGPVS